MALAGFARQKQDAQDTEAVTEAAATEAVAPPEALGPEQERPEEQERPGRSGRADGRAELAYGIEEKASARKSWRQGAQEARSGRSSRCRRRRRDGHRDHDRGEDAVAAPREAAGQGGRQAGSTAGADRRSETHTHEARSAPRRQARARHHRGRRRTEGCDPRGRPGRRGLPRTPRATLDRGEHLPRRRRQRAARDGGRVRRDRASRRTASSTSTRSSAPSSRGERAHERSRT